MNPRIQELETALGPENAALWPIAVPAELRERQIDRILLWSIPLRAQFRRVLVRDGLLLHGPQGWGEVSPFWDYDPPESVNWLESGLASATSEYPPALRESIPVNVTIPVVSPEAAAALVNESSGCTTAKVKVADPRSSLEADGHRLAAVRQALGPGGKIRVDANGAWDIFEAVAGIKFLNERAGGLEYVEQPCATVSELVQVRAEVEVPIAADESVRRATDPLAVARAEAADILVLKVQPLGGVTKAWQIAREVGLPVVVSSALDSSVGIGAGLALAAALPELPYACGLATVNLFTADVVSQPLLPQQGKIAAIRPEVSEAALGKIPLPPGLESRWETRLTEMLPYLS